MELCSQCNEKPIYSRKLCKTCYNQNRSKNPPDYGLCILCKARPATSKKRQLCDSCYHKQRRNPKFSKVIRHNCEVEFIRNFFNHNNWQHQPASFRLNGVNYSPDFYDAERDTFIEVSGSRQAYHANKDKYEKFKELFPKIDFEVRKTDGSLLNEDDSRLDWT